MPWTVVTFTLSEYACSLYLTLSRAFELQTVKPPAASSSDRAARPKLGLDPRAGLKGLPPGWESLLRQANITKVATRSSHQHSLVSFNVPPSCRHVKALVLDSRKRRRQTWKSFWTSFDSTCSLVPSHYLEFRGTPPLLLRRV